MTSLSGLSSDGQMRPSPPVLASRAAAELMQRGTDSISVRLGVRDLRFAVLLTLTLTLTLNPKP